MRSLAASSFCVGGGEAYERFGDQPSPGAIVITAAGRPVRSPGAIRDVLCLYCRTEKFVYWPPASRLRLANCPGCQRRAYAGRHLAAPSAVARAIRRP